MTSNILIKNIFHMLAYSFNGLNNSVDEVLGSEKFSGIENLFASILVVWTSRQFNRGLYREYVDQIDDLPTVRGKINITETIKNKISHRHVLTCEFGDLATDNIFNQIIKSSMIFLLRSEKVTNDLKVRLRRNLLLLSSVNEIDLFKLDWSKLFFNKANKAYEWPVCVCHFLIEGLLPSKQSGEKHYQFDVDKNLSKLFETFVLNYFRFHYAKEFAVDSGNILWRKTPVEKESLSYRLPVMNADIRFKKDNSVLIIDTKYYSKTLQSYFKVEKFHSYNLYQIFTYVENEYLSSGTKDAVVSGMLLYAKTKNGPQLDECIGIAGHKFFIRTLDLNVEFDAIKRDLNRIAFEFMSENCEGLE